MGNLDVFFRGNLVGQKINGFPYPEKFCRFCEQEMNLISAIHLVDEKEHYKALFVCGNHDCPAWNEEAKKAQAHVYYSSNEAFLALETHQIWFQRETR